MELKKYNIPIVWQSIKQYKVEAESLQQAVEIALKQFFSEPDEQYLEDSFEIDSIVEEWYENEQYDIDKAIENL